MSRYMYLVYVLPMLGTLVMSLIEEDIMPTMLKDCYVRNPLSHQKRIEQSNCLNQYLGHLFLNHTQLGLDQNALDWMDSLGRKMHIRLKRQARSGGGKQLRVRKEIRTLTVTERVDFIDAVNALKSDRKVKPNKYDAFALMHQGLAIPSAHGGYNFVGWHRYYLMLFEDALREKNKRVTLPYFDSTLDFRMKDPKESILWTEIFLGNGKGVVFSGPFSLWVTPSASTFLRRDYGGVDSSLIDPTKLQKVFTKKYHREILKPTAATNEENLEVHHDGVHRWIGGANGHMNDLFLAPQDPAFWLLHCHIDYLWEQFRERQTKLNIISERDYPETSDPYHQPTRPMDYLKPEKTNIYGYSNTFTESIYRYEPAPTCENKCGGSLNVFLYCDQSKGGCVSRSRAEFIRLNGFTNIGYWYAYKLGKQNVEPLVKQRSSFSFATEKNLPPQLRTAAAPKITKPFATGNVDPRTKARKRRSVNVVSDGNSLKLSLDVKLIVRPNTKNGGQWNYVPFDYRKWAVAPILISYGSTNDNSLVQYNSENNNDLDRFRQSDVMNVTVQTDGLTYNGRHIDTVVIDRRTLSSETVVLVAFEKPTDLMKSKAYITVYDSYGDVCQPNCRMSGQQRFRECSGVIKITPDEPLMYMDAVNADSGTSIQPYLKFICRL